MGLESELIAAIYEAALDSTRWQQVLILLMSYFDFDSVGIVAFDSSSPACSFVEHCGYPPTLMQELIQNQLYMDQFDLMGRQWLNKLPPGTVSDNVSYFGSLSAYHAAGSRYVDFLNRHGFHHQLAVVFEMSDTRQVGLGANNGIGKPFNADHRRGLGELVPHFQRALALHRDMLDKGPGHEARVSLPKRLISSYGLTPREATICQEFMRVPALQDLALSLGVSYQSLRSYLKVIYEKTDTRSQAELMRLLMALRSGFAHGI